MAEIKGDREVGCYVGVNIWRRLFSGRMVVIGHYCKLDVLKSTLLMDYAYY